MKLEESGPAGRDLRDGVPLAELTEGEPYLGHLGDEPVVLVRRSGDVAAIGASCSHYGGPLAEGVVVGDTIRCPWHHACFSLSTGEAVGAPALNPVPRWHVETRDGVVHVSGKEEAEPLASFGRNAGGPVSVVIVGAGAAGSAAAEMLRREGYERPIALIDPDSDAPYDRPNLSKDYLAGKAEEEWIPLRPQGFYAEHGIDRIVAGVSSIDVEARTVQLSNGSTMGYGALLLASGSSPVRLSIPGSDLPHTRTLRSLANCHAIIAAAEDARRVVVLGASFIGMEVAASLRMRGLEVTVVAPDAVPFERTLGPALGRVIHATHESQGVRFRLGHTATEIGASTVRLDDGSELDAELVVVGIGVRPDMHLAESAGLEVDDGVIVDAYLETSAPGIYAAGDVARYPYSLTGERIRVEHWVAAQRQGQAAARNILGRRHAFRDPPFFWTQQWDMAITYVGHARRWDSVTVEGDLAARDAEVRYLENGQVRALATLGRDRESLRTEAAMEDAVREPALSAGRSG